MLSSCTPASLNRSITPLIAQWASIMRITRSPGIGTTKAQTKCSSLTKIWLSLHHIVKKWSGVSKMMSWFLSEKILNSNWFLMPFNHLPLLVKSLLMMKHKCFFKRPNCRARTQSGLFSNLASKVSKSTSNTILRTVHTKPMHLEKEMSSTLELGNFKAWDISKTIKKPSRATSQLRAATRSHSQSIFAVSMDIINMSWLHINILKDFPKHKWWKMSNMTWRASILEMDHGSVFITLISVVEMRVANLASLMKKQCKKFWKSLRDLMLPINFGENTRLFIQSQ